MIFLVNPIKNNITLGGNSEGTVLFLANEIKLHLVVHTNMNKVGGVFARGIADTRESVDFFFPAMKQHMNSSFN